MAKDTLLDIVQQILSDADGDEVNSIEDTIESDQCARVVRDVFDQIVDTYDLKHYDAISQLDATGASTPTVMTRPEGYYNIEWIKYDVREAVGDDQEYRTITYLHPTDFINITSRRSASDTNVEEMTLSVSSHSLLIVNDKAPTYWTILEDYDSIVFDSYDSDLETNLQASKSLAFGISKPSLTLLDGSIPDLPKHLSVLLKREARAMYFDLYKDGITAEIDRTRRRAETRAQRMRRMVKNTDNQTGPNYGRK